MATASQTVRAHVLPHGCSCDLCHDDERVAVLVRREPERLVEREPVLQVRACEDSADLVFGGELPVY